MGILDNFEGYLEKSAWDEEFHFESKPIPETDNMGREKFWEDLGRPDLTSVEASKARHEHTQTSK